MTKQFYCEKFMPYVAKTGFTDARNFDLTLVSASLPKVWRWSGGDMKVYAEVSLDGGAVEKTEADVAGGTNPTWNLTVHYPITESSRGNLVVNLFYKRRVLPNQFIGEVKISVKQLFEKWRKSEKTATHTVEGTSDGRLNIFYDFVFAG